MKVNNAARGKQAGKINFTPWPTGCTVADTDRIAGLRADGYSPQNDVHLYKHFVSYDRFGSCFKWRPDAGECGESSVRRVVWGGRREGRPEAGRSESVGRVVRGVCGEEDEEEEEEGEHFN